MISKKISGDGTFPSICWDQDSRCVRVAWQIQRTVGVADIDPATLSVLHVQSWDVVGTEASYPELGFANGRCYVSWRDGAPPYAGHLKDLDTGDVQNMEPFHGARPSVFGGGSFAWINDGAGAGWPTQYAQLHGLPVTGKFNRKAAGTGLSHIDETGQLITTIDEARSAFANMTDPSWVPTCVVGATDVDGQPTLRARLFANNHECLIAKGQVSKDPRICTDGSAWYIVAWSDQKDGVRIWKLFPDDFAPVDAIYPRTPHELTRPDGPKYLGHYHTNSKYGEYFPDQNCPVLGVSLYTDGEGHTPGDADHKVLNALQRNDLCVLLADRRSVEAVRDEWSKVAALALPELDSPEQVRQATATVHNLLADMGMPSRRVMSTLTAKQTTDPAYNGTADIAGVELYFDKPPASFTAMEQMVFDRVDQVLAAHKGDVMLIVQSYDRSRPDLWSDDMLEAIQWAAHEAMCQHDRIIGCLWFSYARPTGVLDHPALEPWHNEAWSITAVPSTIDDGDDPMPEAKVYFPNDEQNINALQRISVDYVNVLKRAHGIFDVPPDGQPVAIPRPGDPAGIQLDTKSLAVWLGRYFNYFNQYKGDHERSITQVLTDIRNSPEGQAANPQ